MEAFAKRLVSDALAGNSKALGELLRQVNRYFGDLRITQTWVEEVIMTNEERDFQRKLRVLRHTEKIGNIRKACRCFGVGRSPS